MPGVDLPAGTRVNDVHARLNATEVGRVLHPEKIEQVAHAVWEARRQGYGLAIAGARHAMGGQQFLAGGWLLDTSGLSRIHGLDDERGLVEADAGVRWPELVEWLSHTRAEDGGGWGIVQKQTGADRLSLGGALAANVHGRVLAHPPIVADVESFVLVDAGGTARLVSRDTDPDLFRLAIGGYGLFGPIARVTLRLERRTKVRRHVSEAFVEDVIPRLEERIADGHRWGDFQFGIAPASPDFLRRGVLSTYAPVPLDTPIEDDRRALSPDDWSRLLVLAHTDPDAALEAYLDHYLSTDGQVYWSDTHQMGFYEEGYHTRLDAALGAGVRATEVIGEHYVPRAELASWMEAAAASLRAIGAPVIYGTVRLIEPDQETFLPWARGPWACVVVNLHTPHDRAGIDRSRRAFRALIDHALDRGGSYYLTYHRWATTDQLLTAYPELPDFVEEKERRDPAGVFRSDWYEDLRRRLGG